MGSDEILGCKNTPNHKHVSFAVDPSTWGNYNVSINIYN